jgi:ribose transport system permease protein
MSKLLRRNSLLVVFVLAVVFFTILRPAVFPTIANAGSIMSDNAVLTLVALGVMMPLIVGQFDLSVGSVASLAVMLTAGLLAHQQLPWPLVLICVLLTGAVAGCVMGLLIGYLGLDALIVSLGVGSAISGLVLMYSNGQVIYQGIPKTFLLLGQTRLVGFVPLPFIYALVVAAVLWFVLNLRPAGRRLYAIGGSPEAARLIGINLPRNILYTFICSSTLASLAGFVQVARLGAGHPTGAQSFLLPAFAAAFLGATSFRPGYYNVWGTVVAVYLVGIGTTGLFMLGAQTYVQPIFNGTLLVVAIAGARLEGLRKSKVRATADRPTATDRPAVDTTLVKEPASAG